MKYLSPATFIQPKVITATSSFGHVPFIFWLVTTLQPRVIVELGTMFGYTFAAFCQASQLLKKPAKCFAVDTWEGDENTGKYEMSLYDSVKSMLETHFSPSDFLLLKMKFEAAVREFEKGSVDLLFIDGCHTYEAVSNDFATWRHTLSARSVVLFHDTQVEKPGFGVKRFWNEVTRQYPSFEFHHDHGLGVLVTGQDVPETITELAAEGATTSDEVRTAYASLGEKYRCQWDLLAAEREIAKRDHRLSTMQRSLSWRLTAPLRWADKLFSARRG